MTSTDHSTPRLGRLSPRGSSDPSVCLSDPKPNPTPLAKDEGSIPHRVASTNQVSAKYRRKLPQELDVKGTIGFVNNQFDQNGTIHVSGLSSAIAITISSPAAARSTSAENCALASRTAIVTPSSDQKPYHSFRITTTPSSRDTSTNPAFSYRRIGPW